MLITCSLIAFAHLRPRLQPLLLRRTWNMTAITTTNVEYDCYYYDDHGWYITHALSL